MSEIYENCAWNAGDVLNVVQEAEYITRMGNYLVVWHGNWSIYIYDLTDPVVTPHTESLYALGPNSIEHVLDVAIAFIDDLDSENETMSLTEPSPGAIVKPQ